MVGPQDHCSVQCSMPRVHGKATEKGCWTLLAEARSVQAEVAVGWPRGASVCLTGLEGRGWGGDSPAAFVQTTGGCTFRHWQSLKTFLGSTRKGRLLVSRGWRPEVLPNILQSTGRPHNRVTQPQMLTVPRLRAAGEPEQAGRPLLCCSYPLLQGP